MSPSPLVVCDLDGVIWVGNEPVWGVGGAVRRLRNAGCELLFLTNNSSLPRRKVVQRLADAGITATTESVVTSAVAAADLLTGELDAAAPVMACGGPGLEEALEERGFRLVERGPCEAVVVGWHRGFDFDRLERASSAIRHGARFVATNLDATYPTPRGLVPGNGALVAAVSVASGRDPEVAGKPEWPTVEAVRKRAGGGSGVVVGDRPSSDGVLAAALGWPFVLVRSDVSATEDGEGPAPEREGGDLPAAVDDVLDLLDVDAPIG